jgi:Putative amidoligase enzyme
MSAESTSIVEKFGVELEMVLAFHEDRLIPVLQRRGLTKNHIVKRLSKRDQSMIGIKTIVGFVNPESRPSYRGWALRKDPNDPDDWKHRISPGDADYRAGYTSKYRTYWAEPLGILRNILEEHDLNADIELSSHPADPKYDDWKVTNDCSLVPLSEQQKLECFQDRITPHEADNWDTTGVELVTPPLRVNNPIVFEEIDKYLTALRGNKDSTYGIVTSKYAGLHVHIGFGRPTTGPTLLQIMQHLAYMWILFEKLLVRFFPPHRDGGRPGNIICANDTRSNLAAVIEWEMKTYGTKEVTLQHLASTIFLTSSMSTLRQAFHYDRQHKGYLVNFINIELASIMSWKPKRTVEFRLHESTIDAHEIEMWVRLCLAFCRTAERQSARSTDRNGAKITEPYSGVTEASKYRKQKLDEEVTTTEFFDLLELSDDLREYWQARWAKYHDDQDMELNTPEFGSPFSPSNSDKHDTDDNNDNNDDDPDDEDPKDKGRKVGRSFKSPSSPKGKGKGKATDKGGSLGQGMGKSNTFTSKSKKGYKTNAQPVKPTVTATASTSQTSNGSRKRKREALTASPTRTGRVLRSAINKHI